MSDAEARIIELETAIKQLREENTMLRLNSKFMNANDSAFNYVKNMIQDDTVESIAAFLETLRLTPPIMEKIIEVYNKASNQTKELNWSNAWLLQRRSSMFKLQMIEFKNSIFGSNADSLLSSDFDLAIEILTTKLAEWNRKYCEEPITKEHKLGKFNPFRKSGNAELKKLGKFNPFRNT